MARQEVISVFSDGLMTDLNPINTPKSVLTDCLNGTLVTYNGNEFILQNDMGNYKLENCKLPTNFIPVGIKGYADILYIVSYNPISKEVEIGSYPAPQSIFVIEDQQTVDASDADLCPFYFGETVGGKEQGKSFIRYNDIIDQQKHPLFIFIDGANEDTYKLYPGDEFKLDEIDVDYLKNNNYFIYQHLNFYVIDSDNKLYDLDDAEIYSTEGINEQGFKKVFWETPGWLAAQYDLFVPDKFNLNVRSMTVPSVLEKQSQKQSEETTIATLDEDPTKPPADQMFVSLDLSAQTIISDELFQQTLELDGNQYKHLYTRFLVRINNTEDEISNNLYGDFRGVNKEEEAKDYTPGDWNDDYNLDTKFPNKYKYIDINCQKHNYQDDIITAFNNLSFYWWFTKPTEDKSGETANNFSGYVEVTAFPIIKYNNGTEKTLEYTQFASTISFDLNNLPDSNDITIGDSIYKWAVDDDSCTVSFNILGPFINTGNMIGKYEIYRVNKMNYVQTSGAGWDAENNRPTVAGGNSQSTWSGIKPIQNLDEFVYLNESGKKTPLPTDGDGLQKIVSNDTQVLVAKGDIPNLILFGQNTINIDFKQANVLELTNYRNWYFERSQLNFKPITRANPINPMPFGVMVPDPAWDGTTSKNLTFEKEGGVYKLRIILNDGTTDIISKDLDLIPSEVFNTWFGSVDNYLTSITGTMWVNRYLETVNIESLNLTDLQFDYSQATDPSEGWLEYRWGDRGSFIPLTKNDVLKTLTLQSNPFIYKYKQNLQAEDWILTEEDLLKLVLAIQYPDYAALTIDIARKTINLHWAISTVIIDATNLQLRINASLLSKQSYTNKVAQINSLKGNLWNPILQSTITLYDGADEILSIEDNVEQTINVSKKLDFGNIPITATKWNGYRITEYSYPFLDAIAGNYMFDVNIQSTIERNWAWSSKEQVVFGKRNDPAVDEVTTVIKNGEWNSRSAKRNTDGPKLNMGDSNGANIQENLFNNDIAIAYGLGVHSTIQYDFWQGNADAEVENRIGIGEVNDGKSYTNFNDILHVHELQVVLMTQDKELKDFSITNCFIVKQRQSNYSVLCYAPRDIIFALCLVKYLSKTANNGIYFPQMSGFEQLLEPMYNLSTKRYSANLNLSYLRCDDYNWAVNDTEEPIFTISNLNKNKTLPGIYSTTMYIILANSDEFNSNIERIITFLEDIQEENNNSLTTLRKDSEDSSEWKWMVTSKDDNKISEVEDYLYTNHGVRTLSVDLSENSQGHTNMEYNVKDIFNFADTTFKNENEFVNWYNKKFSTQSSNEIKNIASIRHNGNDLSQAFRIVVARSGGDGNEGSFSNFYFDDFSPNAIN